MAATQINYCSGCHNYTNVIRFAYVAGYIMETQQNKTKTSIAAPLKTKDKLVPNDGSDGSQNRWLLPAQNLIDSELN